MPCFLSEKKILIGKYGIIVVIKKPIFMLGQNEIGKIEFALARMSRKRGVRPCY